MSIYCREHQYIQLLSLNPHTVKELAQKLFISEPTVRRDLVLLREKELITCKRGLVTLKINAPDQRIPIFIRHLEQSEEKAIIARKAAKLVQDGNIVMLDASTTAFHLLPFLANFKNILVITNGLKTALEAVALGIHTISTGGEITQESFSHVGADAEAIIQQYNADIAFISCHGLTADGIITDTSIPGNSIRRIMIRNSKKSYLLCDRNKIGKKYLHTLCNADQLNGVITD